MASGNQQNQSREHSGGWRKTIDGWVNEPAIRRHFLIALGMVLISITATVAFTTSVLDTILASAALTTGITWWLHRHRRLRTPRRDQQ